MPLKRTPPASPLQTLPTSAHGSDINISSGAVHLQPEPALHHCVSAPDLTSINTKRGKKRKQETDEINITCYIREMFATFSKEQEQRFKELKASIELMSNKHDEFLSRISVLETERKEDKTKIQILEEKIETLERKSRAASIEIRNIPKNNGESKDNLCDFVVKIGNTLNIDIKTQDIKDIYRLKSKDSANPIVAEFSTVLLKEKLISAVKLFNKTKKKGEKLNTSHMKLQCPQKPIFISETLTYRTQRIFFLARNFQKTHGYTFCWTSHGVVYLRKNENTPQIKINSEAELENLRKKE